MMYNIQGSWPTLNEHTIKILGLFQEDFNIPKSKSELTQFVSLFKAAILLSQRYNITVNGQFIGWHIEQTNGSVMETLRRVCDVVLTSNIIGIVGPRLSREAHTIADFAKTIGLPVVSYAATDPDLSSRSAFPSFYRTIPPDTSASVAIF